MVRREQIIALHYGGVTFLNNIDLKFMFKDTECVRMQSGKYSCVIAPKLGAAVLRLRDMVGRDGFEPSYSNENRFTVCRL